MWFPGQAREYERTCAECGYTWRVPKAGARRRFKLISALFVAPPRWSGHVDRAELGREVASISAANELSESLRRCPRCGCDHFAQAAVRG
jgi:ribosomal protein S27AE